MSLQQNLPVVSPPTPNSPLPLDRLPVETCGVVHSIEVAQEDMERLKTMGICVGRRVRVVKAGDPMIVCVMDSRIGLAARLATFVYVKPGMAG
jgi:Fe2+ transport system protein FeoA